MTSEFLMSQKNTPLLPLDALVNTVAAIGLRQTKYPFRTLKESFIPFVWAFKC